MKKFALIPILALTACAFAQSPVEKWNGKPIPAFSLVSTTGQKLNNASLKGKVYLIDFWATWCGPCKAAMPTMQKLHSRFKAQGFQVIGANILEQGGPKPETAAKFQKAAKLTYTFAKNTASAEKFADMLGVQGIPTFLLVDKKGIVREVQVGFSPSHEAELAKKIANLLK